MEARERGTVRRTQELKEKMTKTQGYERLMRCGRFHAVSIQFGPLISCYTSQWHVVLDQSDCEMAKMSEAK